MKKNRKEEIKIEKREKILRTALGCFSKYGYHNTTIDEIAKKAGISKGLIYNYFESKEHLLNDILNKASEEIYQYFDPNSDGVLTKDEFYYFIEKIFKTIELHIDFWRLYTALVVQPEVYKNLNKIIDERSFRIVRLMEEFFKNNNISNYEDELLMFISLLKGATIQYITFPEKFPLEKAKNVIIKYYKSKIN